MSKFDEIIERLKVRIIRQQEEIEWLISHREPFESAGVENIDAMGYSIDVNNPTREQSLAIIRAFGGDWEKNLTPGMSDKVNYTAEIDGRHVRLWASAPPPSCRLVEQEYIVPAQPERIEKRMVLKCTEAAV